jgi:hypothetical protein
MLLMRLWYSRVFGLSNVYPYILSFGAHLPSFSLLPRNIKTKLCRITSLPVVLYGCGTWSLTLWEERRLRVFENRALRRMFGPKRDEDR